MQMRRFTSRLIALERANDVVEEKLSATARLARVQQVIDENPPSQCRRHAVKVATVLPLLT